MLNCVSCFFVQDELSGNLLHTLGIQNVIISGDTRLDRVIANAVNRKPLPGIDEFKNRKNIFIAGSTWPQDEALLATLVTQYPGWKFIFAPHEITELKMGKFVDLFPKGSVIRYSQIGQLTTDVSLFNILIIDNIGMLSSLYQYGKIAYIGGGFGAGIHNTLEAAAFALPVIFGPNYSKFKEAVDFISIKAGFSVGNEIELKAVTNKLINDNVFYNNAVSNIKKYIDGHTGATKIIIDYISTRLK